MAPAYQFNSQKNDKHKHLSARDEKHGYFSWFVQREFLEKYTQHTIPDESTLRKTYAPSIYDETIQKIRDEIKDSSIWVSIDETPDKEGRLVGNVVIGLLSEQYSERILLHCDVLEKCNNKTIVKLFNEVWVSCGKGKTEDTGTNKTTESSQSSKQPSNRVECKLTSVLELRRVVEERMHLGLRDLLKNSSFVGCVSPRQALIQHDTKLYLCNTAHLSMIRAGGTLWYDHKRKGTIIASQFIGGLQQTFLLGLRGSTVMLPIQNTYPNGKVEIKEEKIEDIKKTMRFNRRSSHQTGPKLLNNKNLELELFAVPDYKYLPDVIQSLEEEGMKKIELWKKLMSVRDNLDGFAKVKFELNLKRNSDTMGTMMMTDKGNEDDDDDDDDDDDGNKNINSTL
ncbi:hypothetical protein ANN_26754 [Periplaneta americana]|uniref:DNA mismatch repair protein Mlh1 C-terminal domain-containing protein n=1 Tax=Periplaneta americana TaxID=6978 RepID=A0ABQ8RZ44_PERAM|nr:hypothetical protein ANN_26754 [Periplaneta americana]